MTLNFIMLIASAISVSQQHSGANLIDNGWIAPSNTAIPVQYLAATKALLGNGLADPRGGEFHKVTVVLGYSDQWLQSQTLQEKQGYGWILPDKQVVLVDGLKYSLKTDLGRANPADLIALKSGVSEMPKWNGVDIKRATNAMPALLLARGETTLAEECWKLVSDGQPDPILDFYAQLTYRYYMQVAQYILEKDNLEAAKWAAQLVLVSEAREKAGVNYEEGTVGWRFDAQEPKQILRDLIRRIEHQKPKFSIEANAKLNKHDRIAGLIEALDQVVIDARWVQDPITYAIAEEGDAAVPALLDVIANDDRMTRSVTLTYPKRTIHPVRTAAYACVESIWPASSTVQDEDPKIRIANLRKLWKSSANLTAPERWLNVLRDDKGTGKTWLLAAQKLTDSPNMVRSHEGEMKKSKGMQGNPLRTKNGSEITALLTKRIDSLITIDESSHYFEFTDGLSIAHCLALWSGKAAIPTLQRASKNTLTMVPKWTESGGEIYSNLVKPLSLVISDRSNLGDKTAAKDFAKILPYYQTNGFDPPNILLPLWKCPNDKEIQKAGALYLARILSEVSQPSRTVGVNPIDTLLRSPMLISPAFRAFLVDTLDLQKVIGTATVVNDPIQGSIHYNFGNSGGGSMQAPKGIMVTTYLSKDFPLTSGDLVTQLVASAKGAPQFLLSWPEPKKASAKKEIANWLKNPRVDWVSVVKANPFAQMDYN